MQFGCIGEHLGHSFSEPIHRALADYGYELCELAPDQLPAFFRTSDFLGINVTIPYKEAVIPFLDEISDEAREIGAVNTIVRQNGKLLGYNTDFYGMTALINRMGLVLSGKKTAVLGTGGTSRTAVAVAKAMGAACVFRVSRTAREGAIDYETLLSAHRDTQIIINTTPCGMFPRPDGEAVAPADFPELSGVVDAVYNPLRPQLVLDARRRGIPAEGGLYMLVAQAVRASELFLGKTYPGGTADRVFRQIASAKENIVLTGMPGSGKTTVGALIAKKTGRPFVDLDEEIVRSTGKPITAVFAEGGEDLFRTLETGALRELSQQNGIVLALGGGTILRDENVDLCRRNGRICFLDRPLRDLIPTSDRPLSATPEQLEKRYCERYGRYAEVADVTVPVRGNAESVADAVIKEFEA